MAFANHEIVHTIMIEKNLRWILHGIAHLIGRMMDNYVMLGLPLIWSSKYTPDIVQDTALKYRLVSS